jgi:hypothetical protein
MKILLIILLTLSSVIGICQKYPDTTKLSPLIKVIAKNIQHLTVTDSVYHVNEHQFYKQLKLLRERAKTYELLLLTEHQSPFVRLHAFDLLLTLAYPNFVDVLAKHVEDTDTVFYHPTTYGCLYDITTVAKQMASLVSSNNSWVGKVVLQEADEKRLTKIIDKIWERK